MKDEYFCCELKENFPSHFLLIDIKLISKNLGFPLFFDIELLSAYNLEAI